MGAPNLNLSKHVSQIFGMIMNKQGLLKRPFDDVEHPYNKKFFPPPDFRECLKNKRIKGTIFMSTEVVLVPFLHHLFFFVL